MFNKDELLSKDVAELLDIAANIGADVKSGDDKESVIYSILDRQAVAESLNAPVVKRKRLVRLSIREPTADARCSTVVVSLRRKTSR